MVWAMASRAASVMAMRIMPANLMCNAAEL
jgi:hypothetical protein